MYKTKPFNEIFIGDLFSYGGCIWKRVEGINFLHNAQSTDGITCCIDDDEIVTDINDPIKPRVKRDHLGAGDLEYNAMCEFTVFSKLPVNKQFSSLATTYTKTSLTRLEDGSNAVRLDGSTAFIADNRKVEIYR